jgi:outer membrane protein assembly factor BamD
MRVIPSLFIIAAIVLSGCSSTDDITDEGQSEKQIYQAAERSMRNGNNDLAIKHFQLLEARYPFGPYAEQAQLELVYAYYKNLEYGAAIEAASRFIRLHPQHPNVDYAYYMKGMANYSDGKGIFEKFTPVDLTERDPGGAALAFNDFSQLLNRYPNSDYAADAKARMIYLRNILARSEINIANYNMRRTAFLGAVRRARYVVEHYPESPAVPDALALMVQGYMLLDLNDLAEDSLLVLKTNFPEHPNLDEEGNFIPVYDIDGADGNWLANITGGLFGRDEPKQINNKTELN